MLRLITIGAVLLLATNVSGSEEPVDNSGKSKGLPASDAVDPNQPKTMSGMSILGNEEAPKSLVIIPWKASELGSDPSLSDTLNDRARPVDKEVFLRELAYYEIRESE